MSPFNHNFFIKVLFFLFLPLLQEYEDSLPFVLPEETEDGRIRLEFQGITFLMEAVDECLFVNLIWPWCHSFSIYDIDEFARVRKVVNEINMNSSCSVFYIPNPESDEVAVHIKKHFLLTPQIPNLEEYMKVMFRSFFVAQRDLVTEIEKYRLQECEK